MTLINQKFKAKGMVFTDQAFVSAGNFLTTVIVARELGLLEFGLFATAWLIVLITTSMVMGFAAFPMMSKYHLLPENEQLQFLQGTVGTFLLVIIPFSILGSVCYFMVGLFWSEEVQTLVWPVILLAIAINLQDLQRRALIVQGEISTALVSDIMTYGLRLLLLLCFSYVFSLNLVNALLIFTVSAFVGCLFFNRELPLHTVNLKVTRQSWSYNRVPAKWLVISGLMQWTSINLFILLAAFLISPAAVAIIRICQSLLAIFNVFIQALENIMPMQASKMYKERGGLALRAYLVKMAFYGALPFFVLSVVMLIYGGEIISIVYGDAYRDQVYVALIYYSFAYVFVYLIVPVRIGLRTLEATSSWFAAYVVSTIFSLSSVYYLETVHGVVGAVVGILLAHFVLVGLAAVKLLALFEKDIGSEKQV